jgi:hypothetical protein
VRSEVERDRATAGRAQAGITPKLRLPMRTRNATGKLKSAQNPSTMLLRNEAKTGMV